MNDVNKKTTSYSIENPAGNRPLETYAVNRICQLEAQVADQESYIEQLKDALDQCAAKHCELMSILRPTITLTQSGDIRKLKLGQSADLYCLYDRDTYYKLVKHFDLREEDYKARMQEYENEVLNGTTTDLNDEEREEVKADYERSHK